MSDRKRGRPAHGDILTPAEWAAVEGVRHGLANRTIARRQGVSMDADGTEEWMAFFNDPDRRPLGMMASASPG